MFISSFTLTAVFLACVCFCVILVSATTATTSTPASDAVTKASSRGGKHHHQGTEDNGSGVRSRKKIHNFISTDALYDGEQERRIHYNGVTAKETAVNIAETANSTR